MSEKGLQYLIFIIVLLFALIGIILVGKSSLSGRETAEISSADTSQPEQKSFTKEQIEQAIANATQKAVSDIIFLKCLEATHHPKFPAGALKGVVLQYKVKYDGKEEIKTDVFVDTCSSDGKSAVGHSCNKKQVVSKEVLCDKRCIIGLCR